MKTHLQDMGEYLVVLTIFLLFLLLTSSCSNLVRDITPTSSPTFQVTKTIGISSSSVVPKDPKKTVLVTPHVTVSVSPAQTANSRVTPTAITLPSATPRPPGVWIESPATVLPIRASTILYFAIHALVPNGLSRIELRVNDEVVATQDLAGEREYFLVYGWQSRKNGDFRILARAVDAMGTEYLSVPRAQAVRGGIDNQGQNLPPIIGSMQPVLEGQFRMGSDDGPDEEKPIHDVQVSAFHIDSYPVTVGQFRDFVMQTKYVTTAELAHELITRTWHIDDDPLRWDHPVRFVSWYDADHYCRAQGKLLPTEAQWEYAARGSDFRRYPWGNDFDESRVPKGDTEPVGFYTTGVSPFGVYDLSGNVWEWTEDWFDPIYYRSSPKDNPHPENKTDQKSMRGGGFGSSPADLRSSRRIHNFPTTYHADVGFRCIK